MDVFVSTFCKREFPHQYESAIINARFGNQQSRYDNLKSRMTNNYPIMVGALKGIISDGEEAITLDPSEIQYLLKTENCRNASQAFYSFNIFAVEDLEDLDWLSRALGPGKCEYITKIQLHHGAVVRHRSDPLLEGTLFTQKDAQLSVLLSRFPGLEEIHWSIGWDLHQPYYYHVMREFAVVFKGLKKITITRAGNHNPNPFGPTVLPTKQSILVDDNIFSGNLHVLMRDRAVGYRRF